MKSRAELKDLAKQQIKGKIGMLFVVTLIIAVISGVASALSGAIPVAGLAVTVIVTPALSLSLMRIYLAVVNQNKTPEVKDVISGFDDFWAAFKASLLVGVFTFLWSLLLYIPGIIKFCSYSQTMYIVAENKGIGAREAINRSKAMMEGHKMEYFVLLLSFIGWYFLCAITFGIAAIWVAPYVQTTLTNFYNEVKGGNDIEE